MMHPDQIALKAHHADLARDFQPKRRSYGKSGSGFRGSAISVIVVIATMSFASLQFGLLG